MYLGSDERRVEVKGTIGEGLRVDVTAGEANAARSDDVCTDLFIVSLIDLTAEGSLVSCVGGDVRVIQDWMPSDRDLKAVTFRNIVPMPYEDQDLTSIKVTYPTGLLVLSSATASRRRP